MHDTKDVQKYVNSLLYHWLKITLGEVKPVGIGKKHHLLVLTDAIESANKYLCQINHIT